MVILISGTMVHITEFAIFNAVNKLQVSSHWDSFLEK